MTHASLFSGIGGAEIAATWMGWRNLFHCEINPFGRKVLEYWYPNSTSYEDITKTDFSEWRGRVDVLTAGFPCQPFSVAGQRKGADDDRYLWPQVVRAVHEIRPAWVVGENVAGILTMVQPDEAVEVGSGSALFGENHLYRTEQQYVLETVCQDLEREGYSVHPFVIPACAVGAPHRRDRVWIIAHRADAGAETMQCGRENGVHAAGLAADTDSNRQRERKNQQVTVAGCKGASYDCTCGEDGATPDTDEHRHTPCREGGRIETEREERFALPGEREVCSQRPDRLPGLSRDASHAKGQQGERPGLEQRSPCQSGQVELGGGGREDCYELPADRWAGFPTQPPVCRGDDGISGRLAGITFPKWRAESIKALGNAWVPQVAYEIFRAIQQVEDEETTS